MTTARPTAAAVAIAQTARYSTRGASSQRLALSSGSAAAALQRNTRRPPPSGRPTALSREMTHQLPAAAPRRLKDMRPAQVAAVLASDPRIIIPVGTCEQHGPHLPLGCDSIIIERLA